MATSVPELIEIEVQTRLGLIDTDSDYETTASSVQRPARIAKFRPEDFQIVLTQEGLTHNVELSHPGNPPAKAWDLTLKISGTLRSDENDITAIGTLKNRFSADIVKALGDVETNVDWAQWGGLAINSVVGEVENETQGDGSSGDVFIVLAVTLRTDETNLYNNRA